MAQFQPDQFLDTIVAVSTPPGRGAISIIRICGSISREILDSIFSPFSKRHGIESHRACFGRIHDPSSGRTIDQVIALYYQAPRSYTGLDMVEISFHGSPVLAQSILQIILSLGARLAQPGEFTLRAYLNGKMDLTQAEAVRDLIDSQTGYQARLAQRQLEGSLADVLNPIKTALVSAISHLETNVEFVDDDPQSAPPDTVLASLQDAKEKLSQLEQGFTKANLVREGFSLAVVGKPNVGKSSLFNTLLGNDRAIVTTVSGTTRDILREPANIDGIPVMYIDTAGLGQSADAVEMIGMDRTQRAMAEADLLLLVLDSSEPLTDTDSHLLETVDPARTVLVLNKSDLPVALEPSALPSSFEEHRPVYVSALKSTGIRELEQTILARIAPGFAPVEAEDWLITNIRHQRCVSLARDAIVQAFQSGQNGISEEFILYHLQQALKEIEELVGRTGPDDILETIFSTFCIGK